ncbi:uncharacterized protein PHACADRAFT_204776 [Phanerochaete carnosa HHB-10118-sp]|uniref:Uncharacterized protein n=1 Tax=Phanerochaete carnosa (strain HHB-10118-sp) TaxID=650164 RepID=K5VF07_PHACS|nr:uncharacterized protein PHACADRAFT_204776 [Phanerochaete carnosa HHB-10118-sp]EKM61611.1 hypothetical protein PHACADRAFT_204776 [Phanerochaete carnosa HHB-10118-sp]
MSQPVPVDFLTCPSQDMRDALATVGTLISEIGLNTTYMLQTVLPEVALFGVFSLLIVLSTFILLHNGLKRISRVVVAFICMLMYAMAAAHMAISVRYAFRDATASTSIQTIASQCVNELADGGSCSTDLSMPTDGVLAVGVVAMSSSCTTTALLIVNIILSDCIVLWRAWVLWSKRRLLTAISVVLVSSTLVMSSLNVRNSCQIGYTTGNEFTNDVYGLAAFVLSLLTNIWATSLISYKAWRHRNSVRRAFKGGSAGTRSAKILMLFVDSGLLYCGLWILLVAYIVVTKYGISGLIRVRFIRDMENAVSSVLIDIIGMYPTTLVLLVFLTDFTLEGATKVKSIPVQLPAPNRASIITRSNPVFHSTATVMTEDGDPYTQSVIAILGNESSADDESDILENKDHALVV